jgi:hypothetical protein
VRAMTSVGRFVVGLGAFGAVALSAVPSFAKDKDWSIGAGLFGIVGGNFQQKPSAGPVDVNPGFGGVTGGGGLMLDSRFFKLIGLEVDVIRSSDHGSGDLTSSFTFNGVTTTTKAHVTIGQGAWHIPILAKVTFDSPLVGPMIFIGPEIVAPSKSSPSVDPSALAPGFAQTVDTYVMLTFGGGVEFKLPVPVIDLRIPITIRGSWNPSVSDKFSDRTSFGPLGTPITYKSDWQFAVNGTLGAAIYF